MADPNEFEDDAVLDDDLADDWEAELAAQDEADAKAKELEELKAQQAALGGGGGGGKKKIRKFTNTAGQEVEEEVDDEEDLSHLTEDERRARMELQRQIDAAQAAKDIFGGGGSNNQAAGVAALTDMPALASWEAAKSAAELRNFKDRIIEVVARWNKNPNYTAALVPCFTQMFKGLDTASLEDVRAYLDTCKGKIDAKRQEVKAAQKKKDDDDAVAAANKASAAAASSSSTSGARGAAAKAKEASDLFGGVDDRAGVNTNDDDYSMF